MEIHQLRTFATVAQTGSITRAAEKLYLSQPAVSAHIKAIEDSLAIALFLRTSRGMQLTLDGERLLIKAQHVLGAHQEFIQEATRIKGRLTGRLVIGGGVNSGSAALGRLMFEMSDRYPEVETHVHHGDPFRMLEALRDGTLDIAFYNEPADPPQDLRTVEVGRFSVYLAAAPGLVDQSETPDWAALANMQWIYPTIGSSCCGHAAESLFRRHRFRPKKTIGIDRESVARTLIAGGVGVGFLHSDTALEAQKRGEVVLICQAHGTVSVMCACLAARTNDPLIEAAMAILSTYQSIKPDNADGHPALGDDF